MQPFLREPPLGRGPFFSVWHRKEELIPFAWHYHEAFELTLIIQSQGRRLVGDGEATYENGDLVLIGPGLPHTYASDPAVKGNHEQVVVHFDRRLFAQDIEADPSLGSLNSMLQASSRGIRFGAAVAKRVTPLMLRMPKERPLIRLATFFQLLDLLSEVPAKSRHALSGTSYGAASPTVNIQPITKVTKYLEQNFQKQISPIQAARLVAMSPSAFSRFFKKATGRTFLSYVNELRIRHASRLLLETDRALATLRLPLVFLTFPILTVDLWPQNQQSQARIEKAFESCVQRDCLRPDKPSRERHNP
jgi:AraC-like DNA-binding protein